MAIRPHRLGRDRPPAQALGLGGSNQPYGLRRNPVRLPHKAAHFPSARVVENAYGQDAGATDSGGECKRRVGVKLEIVDFEPIKKLLRDCRAARIGGDGHDLEILIAKLFLKRIERGQFLKTRRAPGRPEIHQHRPAAKILQRHGGAVMLKGNRRRITRKIGVLKIRHFADQERLRMIERRRRAGARLYAGRHNDVEEAGRAESCPDQQPESRPFYRTHQCAPFNLVINAMTDKPEAKESQIWGGRFSRGPSAIMEEINASIDIDRRLWREDIAGSKAHAHMLAACGIISDADNAAIQNGLDRIAGEIERGEFAFSKALEDIHMNIEARLKEIIGEPAGRLHTARSRNDQVATDFRLWTRQACGEAEAALKALMRALAKKADAHADAVMPGFTHLQTAQPVTFGHHLLAYVEMFSRDAGRFADARRRMNESPLGAAALAGTSFPIDRKQTAKALGFDRPCANSLDAVSARDFALEAVAAAAIAATHLSRLAEELVLWTSLHFGFVKLSDGFSTGSSIMPQKRNPDAAELVRAKTGRIAASFDSLLIVMKGLPLAYSKDMQEDKAATFEGFDALALALAAMTGMIDDLEPDRAAMKEAAGRGYSTATDLADWLVRTLNMPFRDAHRVTGAIVALAEGAGVPLDALALSDMQSVEPRIDENVYAVLSVEASVASRASYGGAAPSNVKREAERWLATLSKES